MFSSEGDSGDIFGPTGELLQLIDDDDVDQGTEKVSKRFLQPTSSSSADSNPNELPPGGGEGGGQKSFDTLLEYSEFAMDNDCRSDISDLESLSCITLGQYDEFFEVGGKIFPRQEGAQPLSF